MLRAMDVPEPPGMPAVPTPDLDRLVAEAWACRYGDRKRAAALTDEAVACAGEAGARTPRAQALVSFAQAQGSFLRGHPEQREEEARAALAFFSDPDDATWKPRVLGLLAASAQYLGRLEESETWARQGLDEAGRAGDANNHAYFHLRLGTLLNASGRAREAVEHLGAARTHYGRMGDARGEGLVLYALGTSYMFLGAPGIAVEFLLDALQRSREAGDEGIALGSLNNLAVVYGQTGSHEAAASCAREAVKGFREVGDLRSEARAHTTLASALLGQDDAEGALTAAQAAQELRRALGHPTELAYGHLEIAQVYLSTGRLGDAQRQLDEAARQLEGGEDDLADLSLAEMLGALRIEQGRFEEAVRLFERALSLVQGSGARMTLQDLHGQLSKAYEGCGDPAAALDHLKRREALVEDSFREASDLRLRHVEAVHEVQRARAEAVRANRRLVEVQEEERRAVARELHDDLSQRLVLAGLELELLGREPITSPDEHRGRIDALATKVRAVATDVHRMSHRLHPATVERLGLVGALEDHIDELESLHGLLTTFRSASWMTR